MQETPQYMVLTVREDGEEFGVFYYGSKIEKYLSVFPSDLFIHGKLHDNVADAIEYIGKFWQTENETTDPAAFANEIVRQVEHIDLMSMECVGRC